MELASFLLRVHFRSQDLSDPPQENPQASPEQSFPPKEGVRRSDCEGTDEDYRFGSGKQKKFGRSARFESPRGLLRFYPRSFSLAWTEASWAWRGGSKIFRASGESSSSVRASSASLAPPREGAEPPQGLAAGGREAAERGRRGAVTAGSCSPAGLPRLTALAAPQAV